MFIHTKSVVTRIAKTNRYASEQTRVTIRVRGDVNETAYIYVYIYMA